MRKRNKQLNIRFTAAELERIRKQALTRDQTISEFLRDLLLYGALPAAILRR